MADGSVSADAEAAALPPLIVLVDDHRLLAQMLVDQLVSAGHRAVSVDHTGAELVGQILDLQPDLILLDAVFGDDENFGLQLLRSLRAEADTPVAILTGVTDDIRHAEFLDSGAHTVIAKADSFDGVVDQIRSVLDGLDPMGIRRRQELAQRLQDRNDAEAAQGAELASLTGRERATLQALVDGWTVDEIAQRRTVAISTVRSQVRSILIKLSAHSQIEAVSLAARAGMRPSDEP